MSADLPSSPAPSASHVETARPSLDERGRVALERLAARSGGAAGDEPPDLSGARLVGADLRERELAGADLRGSDLSRACLAGANLFGARLEGAVLYEADLSGCELTGASLAGANLEGADLSRAGLGHGDLRGARLARAVLRGATLTEARLEGAELRAADLEDARARGADLARADLARCRLVRAELDQARVEGAVLDHADLRGSSLAGLRGYRAASWIGVDLRDIDFTGAYLCRAFIMDQNFIEEFRSQSRWSRAVYWIWWLTSDCGRSVTRWAFCTALLVGLFAWIFTLVGVDYGRYPTALSPLYYSVVTLTTLGYGDVVPASTAGQVAAMLEVIAGYVMLGGLLSIFSNKMASRAG